MKRDAAIKIVDPAIEPDLFTKAVEDGRALAFGDPALGPTAQPYEYHRSVAFNRYLP